MHFLTLGTLDAFEKREKKIRDSPRAEKSGILPLGRGFR